MKTIVQLSSSALTLLVKVVVPTLWIPGFGAIAVFSGDFRFYVAWIIGSLFILWLAVPLKEVSVEGDELLVSGLRRKVNLPISEVKDVSENAWISGRPITVHFKNKTAFGKSVMFIPSGTVLNPFTPHPTLIELRRRILKAGG